MNNINKLNKIIINTLKITQSEISDNLSQEVCTQWDSLNHICLANKLSSEFNVTFTPEELFNMFTVKDIKDTLIKKGVNF